MSLCVSCCALGGCTVHTTASLWVSVCVLSSFLPCESSQWSFFSLVSPSFSLQRDLFLSGACHPFPFVFDSIPRVRRNSICLGWHRTSQLLFAGKSAGIFLLKPHCGAGTQTPPSRIAQEQVKPLPPGFFAGPFKSPWAQATPLLLHSVDGAGSLPPQRSVRLKTTVVRFILCWNSQHHRLDWDMR